MNYHRDRCRENHRIIGAYFAHKAWINGADCVLLDRKILELVLDVERIKDARLRWMKADIKSWFPHFHSLTFAQNESVGSVVMSRVDISEYMTDEMSDDRRIRQMSRAGINAILFSDPDQLDFSDRAMSASLVPLVLGHQAPRKRRNAIER